MINVCNLRSDLGFDIFLDRNTDLLVFLCNLEKDGISIFADIAVERKENEMNYYLGNPGHVKIPEIIGYVILKISAFGKDSIYKVHKAKNNIFEKLNPYCFMCSIDAGSIKHDTYKLTGREIVDFEKSEYWSNRKRELKKYNLELDPKLLDKLIRDDFQRLAYRTISYHINLNFNLNILFLKHRGAVKGEGLI